MIEASETDPNEIFRLTETTTIANAAPINVVTPAPGPGSQQQAGYRLLMDSRTGRILGALNSNGTVGGGRGAAPRPIAPRPPQPQSQPARVRAYAPAAAAAGRGGGVRPVRNPTLVDLTRQAASGAASSSSSSATVNKQFPALSVTPRPQKKIAGNLQSKRAELDTKVKALLVQQASKFTEWLIQQGLVPPEQYDPATKKKLKLGMSNDSKKFPHSGGYVWVGEASGSGGQKTFTSVYKGSVFEASSQAPTSILKLMYHWSCQTNINNVVQWVKADQSVVSKYYEVFRAVCVATVQEEVVNLGGPGKAVEIGVISLGTTSQDGARREVRTEILGVLDRATGQMRLRATEPRPGSTQAERFAQILEPLPLWVLQGSRIHTDLSIDKERLRAMGFTNVVQVAPGCADSNNAVMAYLKKPVPKMFQVLDTPLTYSEHF